MADSAGGALSRAIRGGLPPGVELDEREEALLAAAARQADAVQALEAEVGGAWLCGRVAAQSFGSRGQAG